MTSTLLFLILPKFYSSSSKNTAQNSHHPNQMVFSSEDCSNGIDDDGDGLIDCLDGDCKVVLDQVKYDTVIQGPTIPYRSALFPNVAFVNGDSVDLQVTVVYTNSTSFLHYAVVDDGFKIFFLGGGATAGNYLTYTLQYDFVKSGTTIPVNMNIEWTITDLDDEANRTEYLIVQEAEIDAYTVSSDPASNLLIDHNAGEITFTGTQFQNSEPESSVKLTYLKKSSFQITYRQYKKFSNFTAGYVHRNFVGTFLPSETNCSDGIDNDGDGLIDCQDPDCNTEICTDSIDNDGDGLADCLDPDCLCYAPFSCDVYALYQTVEIQSDISGQGVAGDYILYRTNPNTAEFTFIANLTDNGLTAGINSIGYNFKDGFIYGINPDPPYSLYRINALGEVHELGNLVGLSGKNQAGVINENGDYYVTGSSGRLYHVDLTTLSATLIGSINVNCSDIALNPSDGLLYGWSAGDFQLVAIDPLTASVTKIGTPNTDYSTFGSCYFNAQGELIAYGNNQSITSSDQETLAKIDITSGAIQPIGIGPSTNKNDGCSCTNGVELTKVAVDTICPGDTLTYTFTIYNRTGIVLNNVDFYDSLFNGLVFSSDPYNLSTGLSILGSTLHKDTASLVLNSIQPDSSQFQIDVEIPSDYSNSNVLSNSAFLFNLSTNLSILKDTIRSDDASTISILDATETTITVEICNNGIDDDCDGLVDCDDPDCLILPIIHSSSDDICITDSVDFSLSNYEAGITYHWNFGLNASPATATGPGPHRVSYHSCGSKQISLSLDKGGCSATIDSLYTIIDHNAPSWDLLPSDLVLECQPSGEYADSIAQWLTLNGKGIVSDDCGQFKVVHDFVGLNTDCGNTASTVVNFSAIDSCGNSSNAAAHIQIVDTQAPIIQSLNDTIVDCDAIPPSIPPNIVDSCDTSPSIHYEEVIIRHPSKNWKHAPFCSLLYNVSNGNYDNKGTPSQTDDEISFSLTVIGRNTGASWTTSIAGNSYTGTYYQTYHIRGVRSNGPELDFIIADMNDNTCAVFVNIDSATF